MSVYKRGRSPYWMCNFKVRGQRVRRSTGETVRRKAEEVERQLREKYSRSPAAGQRLRLLALAKMDRTRAINRGIRRPDRVEREWELLVRFFGNCFIDTIDEDSITEYIAHRRGGSKANNRTYGKNRGQTIVRELGALKRMLKRAQALGHIERVPWFDMPRHDPKNMAVSVQEFDTETLRQWFQAIEGEEAQRKAAFYALVNIRWQEMKRIQSDWIRKANHGGHELVVCIAKTDRERVIPLSELAMAIVNKQMQDDPDRLFVFGQGDHYKAYRTASKKIGSPKNVTPRSLRGNWSQELLEVTGDALAVRDAMGHKSIATTNKYLVGSKRRKEIAKGVKVLEEKLFGDTKRSHFGHTNGVSVHSIDRLMEDVRLMAEELKENLVGREGFEPSTNGLKVQDLDALIHLTRCDYCRDICFEHGEMRPSGHTLVTLEKRLEAGGGE